MNKQMRRKTLRIDDVKVFIERLQRENLINNLDFHFEQKNVFSFLFLSTIRQNEWLLIL